MGADSLKNYVEGWLQLPGMDGRWRGYYTWQKESLEPVKIQSYKDHPEVKKIVTKFLRSKKRHPRIQECYGNAFKLSIFDERIGYVLGHALAFIPLAHAWNSYGDFHFDLTAELALADPGGFSAYVKICEINDTEVLMNPAFKSNVSGPDLGQFYTYIQEEQ